jgi:hypothetical protein
LFHGFFKFGKRFALVFYAVVDVDPHAGRSASWAPMLIAMGVPTGRAVVKVMTFSEPEPALLSPAHPMSSTVADIVAMMKFVFIVVAPLCRCFATD